MNELSWNTELMRQDGLGLILDEEERKLLTVIVDRSTQGNQSWGDFLNGQRHTQNQATAYHLLRVDPAGLLYLPLSVKEKDRLTMLVSKDHQKLIESINSTRQNDYTLAQNTTLFLRRFCQVILHLWKRSGCDCLDVYQKIGDERVRLSREAIALIDEHGEYINYMDSGSFEPPSVCSPVENVSRP